MAAYQSQLRTRLVTLLVAAPVFVSIVVSLLVLSGSKSLTDSFRWVTQSMEEQSCLAETLSLITDAETGQRGYLLTEREAYLEPYHAAVARLPAQLAHLRELAAQDAELDRLLTLTERPIREKLSAMEHRVQLQQSGKREEAVQDLLTDKGRQLMEEIRTNFSRMVTHVSVQLEARRITAERWSHYANRISLILVAANLLVVLVVLRFLWRLENVRRMASICTTSKTIRHEGQWITFEDYLRKEFNMSITHETSDEALEQRRRTESSTGAGS